MGGLLKRVLPDPLRQTDMCKGVGNWRVDRKLNVVTIAGGNTPHRYGHYPTRRDLEQEAH